MLKFVLKTVAALLVGISLTACVQIIRNSGDQDLPPKPDTALRAASYNVHYIILGQDTGAWSVGDWERRKMPLDLAFKAVDADFIGFQEMESFSFSDESRINLTLDYLLAQNPDYAAAAAGDPAEFPSTQPILYRRDRLEETDKGWFFFSDTPDVIYSRTFNGSFPAFASWAQFEDRLTGQRFRVINVHFEYSSRSNRLLSAELVVDRITPWIAAGEPVFLVGDLNARLGARTVDILAASGLQFSPVEGSTYHFNTGLNLFGAIDHIATTDNIAPVGDPVVLRRKFAGEWPTDHYPVVADFTLR